MSIILTISILFIPKFVWNDWFVNIIPNGGYGKSPKGLPDPAYSYNKGFNGFFSRIFTNQQDSYQIMNYPLLAKVITYIICIILCIITIFIICKYLNKKEDMAIEKIIFITMPLIFMIAPVSWNLHLITLYPTIIYLFRIFYNGFTNKINFKLILVFLITLFFSMQSNSDISLFFVFILWVMMLEVIIKQQSLPKLELRANQRTQINQSI
ncbi:hypothetical protein [Herpetosiphon gulosus]|uniref:DUF2029 domain-containing protein n=1 Tax=Herpetosiphon gulosus TaxID=1973496 RepID=A0ABP9WWD1_9CHLR